MLAYALSRNLTAQVLGHARLVVQPGDWEQIEDWIRTASAEANASMARWDPQGKGYTVETVAFDLAHLAARSIARLRTLPGSAKSPVETCFEAVVGDWEARFSVRQVAKRGDLYLVLEGAAPHGLEGDLPDIAVEFIRAGKPVLTWGPAGLLNLTQLGRASFPHPGDI
ncbi:MAG: hypothetical protein HY262_09555 [Chloroflexi bacterium]|nr:hypothetical protein [Chloroflexota bacterium]